MSKCVAVSFWLFAASLLTTASAQTVITPSDVTATSSLDANRDIRHVIDGSGLSTGAGDILRETHGGCGNNATYWLGALADNQVVIFTLPTASSLGAIHIWNYDRDHSSWDERATHSFALSFSSDGGSSFPRTINISEVAGGDTALTTPIPVQTFTFAEQANVTHVRMSNIVNHGDPTWNALAEVRFGDSSSVNPLILAIPTISALEFNRAQATSAISTNGDTVILYWGTEDEGQTQTGWDGSYGLGDQDPGDIPNPGDPAAVMSPLTQNMEYVCRYYAQNTALSAQAWSAPRTFSTPNALQLTSPTAADVTHDQADVSVAADLDTDTVHVYWGSSDPGPTGTGWDADKAVGGQSTGVIATTLTGLTENTNYFFRFYATSTDPVASSAWSEAGTFNTPLEESAPVITPVSVVSPSQIDSARSIDHIIDGSGLLGTGDILTHAHVHTGNNSTYWLSANGAVAAGTEYITFTLPQALSFIHKRYLRH